MSEELIIKYKFANDRAIEPRKATTGLRVTIYLLLKIKSYSLVYVHCFVGNKY